MNNTDSTLEKNLLYGAIGMTLAGLLAIVFYWQPPQSDPYDGVPRGGDFTLQSASGPVSLQDYRGKLVVLYFGYTQCPDICPTSLALLTLAIDQLSAEEQERLQMLFISVDPERDSLEHLHRYSRYFHSDYLGVTDTPERVRQAADLYGVGYRRVETDSQMGYSVDHTADLYLVDAEGRLQASIPHGTESDEILAALRQWLPSQP